MARSVADYTSLLQRLLPVGAAWCVEVGSNLTRLLSGFAASLSRVDSRVDDLLREADPRTATESLAEWEFETGLPDATVSDLADTQSRRDAVVARLTALGGQSQGYFIALAAAVGFGVTIEEFMPSGIGDGIGDLLGDEDWAFAWMVHAPETTVRYAGIGDGIGDGLAEWGNELLEATIKRVQPAHTVLMFGYGG